MITRHGPHLMFDEDGVQKLLVKLLGTADAYRRLNGLPKPSELSDMQAEVDAAIAARRTLERHAAEWDREEWVTAKRYAELVGCTDRTARRHAAERGRKLRGQWFIPLERG